MARKMMDGPSVDGSQQRPLFPSEGHSLDAEFRSRQVITYIGNKRALLRPIERVVEKVKDRLQKDRLRIFDAFAGSGVVSRLFKAHAEHLISNDLEDYAYLCAKCFLRNRSEVDPRRLRELARSLNDRVLSVDLPLGFIEEMYSPRNEKRITESDRVFYTTENARRLDNFRRMLNSSEISDAERELLLGPLLSKASVHANTSGVFKGFYKDRQTGVGRYGGTNGDALSRIKGLICVEEPVLSHFECKVEAMTGDANDVAKELNGIDLAYLDPPYNQHPYGSNYFMLNLLVNYTRPNNVSSVSGIPTDWKRSDYNSRSRALPVFRELVASLAERCKYILVSFNDEGFITPEEMTKLLEEIGAVEEPQRLTYNTFRGSRNLRERSIHVTEHLFLVQSRCVRKG